METTNSRICICSLTNSSILCKQLEPFKDNKRHKEFVEIIVSFCLHIDSVTICQVFCRNGIYTLIKYPTASRQSMRRNLSVRARMFLCIPYSYNIILFFTVLAIIIMHLLYTLRFIHTAYTVKIILEMV